MFSTSPKIKYTETKGSCVSDNTSYARFARIGQKYLHERINKHFPHNDQRHKPNRRHEKYKTNIKLVMVSSSTNPVLRFFSKHL